MGDEMKEISEMMKSVIESVATASKAESQMMKKIKEAAVGIIAGVSMMLAGSFPIEHWYYSFPIFVFGMAMMDLYAWMKYQ